MEIRSKQPLWLTQDYCHTGSGNINKAMGKETESVYR